ncbi:hypothetical protein GCM10010124_34430 [Pilimelia terevasa]|uniref:Uncharacterized protein n=1 Tax=Pilimelia terevasa TaxID=53372 RepID=A0A8J3BPJ2_9ACTN|nr:hypothetical protein [Pilimelia terevasa]GGK38726.1 hypothetical protein GCM10010124_34430 [Pilimelia terevasa]
MRLVLWKRPAAAALIGVLAVGLTALPAPAAPTPSVTPPAPTNVEIPASMPRFTPQPRRGDMDPIKYQIMVMHIETDPEPEIRDAARAALDAGPAAVDDFLYRGGYDRAKVAVDARKRRDDQVARDKIAPMRGTGGDVFNAEVERVLAPNATPGDRKAFLGYGAEIARGRDGALAADRAARRQILRSRVQLLAGLPAAENPHVVKDAADALVAGDAAVEAFLTTGFPLAAAADAQIRANLLREREAELKAIEEASDLAQRSALANRARADLITAHGAGVRAVRLGANSMTLAATHARRAAQILAAKGPLSEIELTRVATATEVAAAGGFAGDAERAALTAAHAAKVLVDVQLEYGKDWADMAKGLHLASVAVHQATVTAQHAVDATIATHRALGHAGEAEARRKEAARWRQQAQEHARAGRALAGAARREADAAEGAARRAGEQRIRAESERDRAWEHARAAQAKRDEARDHAEEAAQWRAEAQRARGDAEKAHSRARTEGDRAAHARAGAEHEEECARAARIRADDQTRKAGEGSDRAAEAERRATAARDDARDAGRERDLARARAAGLRAKAQKLPVEQGRDEALKAAAAADGDADDAEAAAARAADHAQQATNAAAGARGAAIETERAAARARHAADQARAAAAGADDAASAAESEAAAAHAAARRSDAAAAAATREEVKAGTHARNAEALSQQAATRAVQALWAADRVRAEAAAAAHEAASAAAQAESAIRSAAAARESASAAVIPASDAIKLLMPFTGQDLGIEFATEVASLAESISLELADAADQRAREAERAALAAQQSADQAGGEIREAYQAAADAAKASAEAAAHSARAKRAAAHAAAEARRARAAAADANAADRTARAAAAEARELANAAAASAAAAGLDAGRAAQLAADAGRIAQKAEDDAQAAKGAAARAQEQARQAREAAIRAEEQAKAAVEFAKQADQHGKDAQKEVEQLEAEIRAMQDNDLLSAFAPPTADQLQDLRDYLEPAQFANFETVLALADGGVMVFLENYGKDLLTGYLSDFVEQLKQCSQGKILDCLLTIIDLLPVGRILGALKITYRVGKTIHTFMKATAKYRNKIRDAFKKVDRCKRGLIKDLAGEFTGVRDLRSAAKKRCRTPDGACADDSRRAPGKLACLTLYHGTSRIAADRILVDGPDVTASKRNTDFCRGMYLTRIKTQAAAWRGGVVVTFKIPTAKFTSLDGLRLNTNSTALPTLVRSCRTTGQGPIGRDYTEGPMLKNIGGFLSGKESPEWFGNQLAFHSPKAQEVLDESMVND